MKAAKILNHGPVCTGATTRMETVCFVVLVLVLVLESALMYSNSYACRVVAGEDG